MLLNNLLGSALTFAQERDERNLYFYIYFLGDCRHNHLLFQALEKGADSDTPPGLPPPPVSLQPLPISLVCAHGWRVTANEEGAATSVQERRKMP